MDDDLSSSTPPQQVDETPAPTTSHRRPGVRWKAAAAAFFGAAIGAAAGLFYLAGLIVRPRRENDASELKKWRERWTDAGIAVIDTSTVSLDGVPIRGWFLPAAGPLVVMLHGVNSSRLSVVRAARWLRHAGYSVLLVDLRGHGLSGGRFATYGQTELPDVTNALSDVCGLTPAGCERIGLFGLSMGAAISIEIASRDGAAACIWVDSPYASLREVSESYAASFVPEIARSGARAVAMIVQHVAEWRAQFNLEEREPARFAAQVHCPACVVHGTADELVPFEQGRKVFDALAGPKEFWPVEGAGHIGAMSLRPKEYRRRLVRFFTANLPLG